MAPTQSHLTENFERVSKAENIFPMGVEIACARAVQQLLLKPTNAQDLMKTTLELLTASYEPLTLLGIYQVLYDHYGSIAKSVLQSSEQLRTLIEDICGSAVMFRPDRAVAFSHSSIPRVWKAVLKVQTGEKQALEKLKIDHGIAHQTLAIHCVRALQEGSYTTYNKRVLIESDPAKLLSYAEEYWIHHICESESTSNDVVEAVAMFLSGKQSIPWLRRRLQAEPPADLCPTVDRLLVLEHNLQTWAARTHQSQLLQAATAGFLRPLFERYLDDLKSQCGPRDPEVLRTSDEFAQILICKGDYMRASSVLEESFTMRQDVYGRESLEAMRILARLAQVQMRQGRWDAADISILIALQQQEMKLTEYHLDVLTSKLCLAEIMIGNKDGTHGRSAERMLAAAEDVLYPVLETSIRHLGGRHQYSLHGARLKARLLAAEGDYDSALFAYWSHRFDIMFRYGHEHRITLSSMNKLGAVQRAAGALTEAEGTIKGVLEQQKRTLGDSHPDILDTVWNLCLLREEQGAYHETIEM